MLYLNENVFVVEGAVKSAVYNLAAGKMYSIGNDVLKLLNRLKDSETNGTALNLSENEKNIQRFLEIEHIYPLAEYQPSTGCEIPYKEPRNEEAANQYTGGFKKTEKAPEIPKSPLGIDFAWLEVTDRCNLKCLHCYEEAQSACSGKTIKWEDFVLAVEQLESNGIGMIQFIGGEPLLHKRLKDMIQYARPRFGFIEVFTNATLINAQWADFFKHNDINIAMSVYSYEDNQHDKVTLVEGSHQRTTNAIALLKQRNVKFRTATICMDGVCIGEKKDACYELDGEHDSPRLTGRAKLRLLNRELIERKMISKKNYFSHYLHRDSVKAAMERHNCFGSKIYISADLNVYPCVMERRFCHGSLKGKPLSELLRQDILELTKDKIQGCRDCEYRYACHDCRPDSMGRDIYAKPWYCSYDPYTGEWDDKLAEKVLAGEDHQF